MEDLIVSTKQKRRSPKRCLHQKPAMLKIQMKDYRFYLSKSAFILLGLQYNDGLMFIFNRNKKTAYITKDNEDDSFKIRGAKGIFCFKSKELATTFDDVFDLLDNNDDSFYFYISDTETLTGWFRLTMKK